MIKQPESQITNRPINIRPMQAADVGQVLTIDRSSFAVPWPKRAFEYEINENKNSMLWVAEIDPDSGERLIVGMIVVWIIVDEAHIATLAVHPEYRRHGIGKQLIKTSLRESINLGAVEATLEVRASNNVAQELYSGFNFIIVGQRPRYYRDNQEDAIIMTVHDLHNIDLLGSANGRRRVDSKITRTPDQTISQSPIE